MNESPTEATSDLGNALTGAADWFSLGLAVLLGAIGLALIIYFVWLVVSPVTRTLRSQKELLRFKKASEKLGQVDALIAAKKMREAVTALRDALFLEIFEKPQLLEALRDHNQNILTHCFVIAEELNSRAENIAEVEKYLNERIELQTLYIRAVESFSKFKDRREKAGKEIPSWSRSDFEEKIVEIRKELQDSLPVVQKALDKLFAALLSTSGESSNIVYH